MIRNGLGTAAEGVYPVAGRLRMARHLVASMRPDHWVKNLFVLAPLLFSRKLTDPAAVAQTAIAFLTFCLVASAVYLFNDVLDAAADRSHPEKRFRSVAAGDLSVRAALGACAVLLGVSVPLALAVDWLLLAVAALYGVLNLGYSLLFKKWIVVDAMVIAASFVLRVVGGAVAVGVAPSHWLIMCAFLLCLYLAFSKRRQELVVLDRSASQHRQVLGQYTVAYLDSVNNILLGASLVSYALYTVAPETVARFGTDRLIYGTAFVVYGLLRYMALIQTSTHGGDPGRLVLRDKPLLAAVVGWGVYNFAVIYHPALVAFWRQLP